MLFAFRREHLIVAAIFASINLLELCDCVCTDKNGKETKLAFTSDKSIYNEVQSIEQAYDEPRRDAIMIDAFNHDICGKSLLRDWQSREQAWDCANQQITGGHRSSARNSSQQRISHGDCALDGEFPSFVHVFTREPEQHGRHRTSYCGGTLIHSNLVITAAHCLQNAIDVTIVLDSILEGGRGGYDVQADSWCYHRNYGLDHLRSPKFDVGIVRLSSKVDYVKNRVWPACLLLDKRHKTSSACAVAGVGYELGENRPECLKTLLIRRTSCHFEQHPYRSCYQADSIGGTCKGDSGSGVYCYDNCYAGEQRAFVVAAVSGGADLYCRPGKKEQLFFADFNWMANSIKAMISKLVSGGGGDDLRCFGPTND